MYSNFYTHLSKHYILSTEWEWPSFYYCLFFANANKIKNALQFVRIFSWLWSYLRLCSSYSLLFIWFSIFQLQWHLKNMSNFDTFQQTHWIYVFYMDKERSYECIYVCMGINCVCLCDRYTLIIIKINRMRV